MIWFFFPGMSGYAGSLLLKVQTLEPNAGVPFQGECILLPPGPGNDRMVKDVIRTMGKPLQKRGWRVTVPTSPDGRSFFGRNARLITSWMAGKPNTHFLVAGVSNGGISALEVGHASADQVRGLIITPGVLRNTKAIPKNLKGIPVFLRVGEKDELKWGQVYPRTVRQLEEAGVVLDAKILKKTGHVFKVNWEELDTWLKTLPATSPKRPLLDPPEENPGTPK